MAGSAARSVLCSRLRALALPQHLREDHQGDPGGDRLPDVDQGEVGRQGPRGAGPR